MPSPETNVLLNIPLFSSLPRAEIELLAKMASWRSFPPQTLLFHEGDPSNSFLIILEGEVEVLKTLADDAERRQAVRGKGEYLGEMSLFRENQVRSSSVRTLTEVWLLEIMRSDFEALLRRQPELTFRLILEINQRFRSSEDLTIQDLRLKNQQLQQAYQELKEAQAQLVAKEKLEAELAVARKIQQDLLPKQLPVLPGWQLAAHWQPARAVSGDFYDFLPLPGDRLAIIIGDVTDKGVPAALVMATTRSVLRSTISNLVKQSESPSPGEALAQVNDLLCGDMPRYMFVTCLLIILETGSGRLRFANAGHLLPTLWDRHTLVELRATGLPLGLLPGEVYDEQEALLEPGDTVLLLSDGMVEAHNPQGEMFGFPRLHALIAAAGSSAQPDGETPGEAQGEAPGKALIAYLLGALRQFTGPAWEQEDDLTFVSLVRAPA